MNESYFLLAALRRKSGSSKEPEPWGSDSEVAAPGVLASLSSRFLLRAFERGPSRVVLAEGPERADNKV